MPRFACHRMSRKCSCVQLIYGVVAGGRNNGNSVMPALGDNPNVACYMDDVYLRAPGSDAVERVRPARKEDKPETYTQAENSCMGKRVIKHARQVHALLPRSEK